MTVGKSALPLVIGSLSLVFVMLGSSCRLEEPSEYAPPIEAGSASAVIGPNGGTLTAEDGTSVDIPAGALNQEVTITITPNPYAPSLTQAQQLADAHLFEPEGQKFLKPVTVSLPYNSANLPAGATTSGVKIFSAPNGSNFYQTIQSQASNATFVVGQTSDFCNMYPGVNSSTTVELNAPVNVVKEK